MSQGKGWMLVGLVCMMFLISCSKLFSVDVGVSQGRGVVRRVDYEHHMVTIDHGLIPNLLQAMTFAYTVRNDSMMNGILPEDTIAFTLQEFEPGSFRVESMTKLGSPAKRTVPIDPALLRRVQVARGTSQAPSTTKPASPGKS